MSSIEIGTEIPVRTTTVEPARMKVFSLLADDPNPIHWDRQSVRALGIGERLVNQGGLNAGYVLNALAEWVGGADRIRTVTMRFLGNVFEGDEVRAGGSVTAVDGSVATLEVWLIRQDGSKVVSGTATVALR